MRVGKTRDGLSGGGFGAGYRGAHRPDQPNKATIHILPQLWKTFPLQTLKTEQGANLQRQQTGSGPLLAVSHTQMSVQARGSRLVHNREQSEEEMKDLILFPLWGRGSNGLGGQGDLLWILGLFSLLEGTI